MASTSRTGRDWFEYNQDEGSDTDTINDFPNPADSRMSTQSRFPFNTSAEDFSGATSAVAAQFAEWTPHDDPEEFQGGDAPQLPFDEDHPEDAMDPHEYALMVFENVSEREAVRKVCEKKGIFDFLTKLLMPLENMESDDPLSFLKASLYDRLLEFDPIQYEYAQSLQLKAEVERSVAALEVKLKEVQRESEKEAEVRNRKPRY
ncbi:uncharacterized protein LOC129589399 [Paramacrobiotus metropolitanus]|uniref:uncharacterized protein LOC129589399 n=1 Tax=Paramacrobiotus metropolitanus TaxID=2943436 RepID=UPI0024463A51|nr:uncharacterized protein LOC129589399 [Paramacrobiotus metropolitanus]